MDKTKTVVKKKFNLLRTIVFVLLLYLIYEFGVYIYKLPIKNIVIIGNNYVSDKTIIYQANIENYPSIIRLNTKKTKKLIEKLDLVNTATIKRKWFGILEITIKENIPLFYKKSSNTVVLSNYQEIDNQNNLLGIPTLINYVPDDILHEFIDAFALVKEGVKLRINNIEYSPSKNEKNEVIEEKRFILTMNDSNIIYIVPKNIENLNYYLDLLSGLKGKRGYISLDSGDYDNFVFKAFNGGD